MIYLHYDLDDIIEDNEISVRIFLPEELDEEILYGKIHIDKYNSNYYSPHLCILKFTIKKIEGDLYSILLDDIHTLKNKNKGIGTIAFKHFFHILTEIKRLYKEKLNIDIKYSYIYGKFYNEDKFKYWKSSYIFFKNILREDFSKNIINFSLYGENKQKYENIDDFYDKEDNGYFVYFLK